MRYLVDTHILLWWLDRDGPLKPNIRAVIDDGSNGIVVSVASLWEMAIKNANGKLDVPQGLPAILQEHNIETLPVTAIHADAVRALPMLHKDPFDRMLVAQALCEDLTIVTHDKDIQAYACPCLRA